MTGWLSIIIPVLNEAPALERLLPYLQDIAAGSELVVADGGSEDASVSVASRYAQVVRAPRGRGVQMNAGAHRASREILWFLHADSHPHPHSVSAMSCELADAAVVGGGFQYSLDAQGFRFRLAERMSNLKNRALSLLYGDMGIFVRRVVFERMGGYAEIPLMEDMDFSRRLKRQGRIVILPHAIETSARRWIEEGYLRCTIRTWLLQLAWWLGTSPETLAGWYRFR